MSQCKTRTVDDSGSSLPHVDPYLLQKFPYVYLYCVVLFSDFTNLVEVLTCVCVKMAESMSGVHVSVSGETGEIHMCPKSKMNAPLHYYTYTNSPDMVEELLISGECVNTVWQEMTPLYLAARIGKVDIIPVLLKHKGDVNATTLTEKKTPLHSAACSGNINIVKILVENKALLNKVDETGVNALWWASQHGHIDVCKYLIVHKIHINKCNRVGISPLAVAVHNGQTQVVKLLIEADCNIDLADFAGCTPLYHAVNSGYREIVQILVAAGADGNVGNNAGDYPIHIAALHGNAPILHILINAGCDVNISAYNGSPIYSAVQRQHMNAVRMLIDCGANLDVQNENQYTPAPIIEAIREQIPNIELIKLLIRSGCNVNVKSQIFNVNTLEYAIMNDHKEVVEVLLKADCEMPPNIQRLKECQEHASLFDLVQQHFRTTHSLKRCCRKEVRKALGYGTNYIHRVATLHLPTILKDFLTFSELSEENCITKL